PVSMNGKRNRPETWLSAVWALLIRVTLAVTLVYVLYRVLPIIGMVLVSVMLALAMAPAVDWLSHSRVLRPLPHKLRRNTATILVFLALTAGLSLLAVFICGPVVDEYRKIRANWADYQAAWAAKAVALQ